jgi:glycosyltransferase involved in cell wall biosynthesis
VKIALLGPIETQAVAAATGVNLDGLPPGTAQTPLAPLAAGLLRLGHAVHLITLDPSVNEPVTVTRDRLTITWCPLRGPPAYRTRARALDLFAKEISALTKAVHEAAPDFVHAHWTYEFAEAAVRSRLRALVTMHDLGWQCFFQFRDAYRFFRLMMKYRSVPRVAHLSVVAPFMISQARLYGYRGTVDVVPNGITLPNAATLRLSHRLLAAPRIVTVGSSGRLKNVKASIEAFRTIRRQLPQAELHLFGPGLDAVFAGGEPGVIAHDNVRHQELMTFLSDEATLLIHPSLFETFGVIIAEAKARGIPVVAGATSGGTSYVVANKGGAVVDVRRPDEIAAAALGILTDSERYAAHARDAREDAANRFDKDRVAERYDAIYRRILGNQASSVVEKEW